MLVDYPDEILSNVFKKKDYNTIWKETIRK